MRQNSIEMLEDEFSPRGQLQQWRFTEQHTKDGISSMIGSPTCLWDEHERAYQEMMHDEIANVPKIAASTSYGQLQGLMDPEWNETTFLSCKQPIMSSDQLLTQENNHRDQTLALPVQQYNHSSLDISEIDSSRFDCSHFESSRPTVDQILGPNSPTAVSQRVPEGPCSADHVHESSFKFNMAEKETSKDPNTASFGLNHR